MSDPLTDAAPARPPAWMDTLVHRLEESRPDYLGRRTPPTDGGRVSAVLMLFGPTADGRTDVVLTERASALRHHANQVAFPGGRADPGDDGPVGTALREASEEVGLRPDGVRIVAELPPAYVRASDSVVTPVLAWWERPHDLYVRSPREVARIDRVRVERLVDPAHRVTVRHPHGYICPAFDLDGLFVWGFTAGLLDAAFSLGGVERPWDTDRIVPLPDRMLPAHMRSAAAVAPAGPAADPDPAVAQTAEEPGPDRGAPRPAGGSPTA